MSSVLPQSYLAPQAILDALFNPDPRWMRSWSTAWHALVVPMSYLDAFTLPTLSSAQLDLQSACESHIAQQRYPFEFDTRGVVTPFPNAYGTYDGAAPVLIGFPDGATAPVLMTVPGHWNNVAIDDVNAPLLAALRSTSQDFVWVAVKWNSVDYLRTVKKPNIPPGSGYP